MPTKEKEDAIKAFVVELQGAKSVLVSHNNGLTAGEVSELRTLLRGTQARHKIVKNTLALRAAKEAGVIGMEAYLSGPTAITISKSDIVGPAKVLVSFAKTHEKMVVVGGVVEGKPSTADDIKIIATLPSKEELIAQLLRTMNGPITGLVRVLNGPISGLARVLNAVAEKKAAA